MLVRCVLLFVRDIMLRAAVFRSVVKILCFAMGVPLEHLGSHVLASDRVNCSWIFRFLVFYLIQLFNKVFISVSLSLDWHLDFFSESALML